MNSTDPAGILNYQGDSALVKLHPSELPTGGRRNPGLQEVQGLEGSQIVGNHIHEVLEALAGALVASG